MIEFQKAQSTFYEKNKEYCETITEEILLLGGKTDGFCDSYGFEIRSEFEFEGKNVKIEFKRSQSTQNGVIVPFDAIDQVYCNIIINNTNLDNFEIKYSTISKFFGGKLDPKYDGKLNTDNELKFLNIFKVRKLDLLKCNVGTVEISSRYPIYDLKELISLFTS